MPKLKNVPFQISNEMTENQQVLTLSGTVRKKYWEDDQVVDEKTVREAIAESDIPLVIRLNSPGGDVFEGISIYNLLKNSEREITVEVTALAASAASVIAMGADKLVMCKGSSLMIHEASSWAFGNKSDIQKTLSALETVDKSLIDIYQSKTSLSEKEINDLLTKESWFTAQEAVDKGFADEVKDITEPAVQNDGKNSTVADVNIPQKTKTEYRDDAPVASKKTLIFGGKK